MYSIYLPMKETKEQNRQPPPNQHLCYVFPWQGQYPQDPVPQTLSCNCSLQKSVVKERNLQIRGNQLKQNRD